MVSESLHGVWLFSNISWDGSHATGLDYEEGITHSNILAAYFVCNCMIWLWNWFWPGIAGMDFQNESPIRVLTSYFTCLVNSALNWTLICLKGGQAKLTNNTFFVISSDSTSDLKSLNLDQFTPEWFKCLLQAFSSICKTQASKKTVAKSACMYQYHPCRPCSCRTTPGLYLVKLIKNCDRQSVSNVNSFQIRSIKYVCSVWDHPHYEAHCMGIDHVIHVNHETCHCFNVYLYANLIILSHCQLDLLRLRHARY